MSIASIHDEWEDFYASTADAPDHLFDFVTDRIAVGRAPWYPKDFDKLVRAGITHVIDCRAESKAGVEWAKHHIDVNYLWCGFHDDLAPKPLKTFRKSLDFGTRALRDPRAKVFVHCAAGMNRGPSVAYGILRASTQLRPGPALAALRAARPIAFAPYRGDVDAALRHFGHCK